MQFKNVCFSGTSLINPDVMEKMAGRPVQSVPGKLSGLPGFQGWRGELLIYDNKMTIDPTRGVVLNEGDEAVRQVAAEIARTYYGSDISKVLYQTPLALTENDIELVGMGLRSKHGWSA